MNIDLTHVDLLIIFSLKEVGKAVSVDLLILCNCTIFIYI